jgi:hypothetical protein
MFVLKNRERVRERIHKYIKKKKKRKEKNFFFLLTFLFRYFYKKC